MADDEEDVGAFIPSKTSNITEHLMFTLKNIKNFPCCVTLKLNN
jgi:hypothetical protein